MGNAIFVTRELEKFTSRQVISVTRRLTLNLRNSTPKKTGFAASNWIPSLGANNGIFGSKRMVSFSAQNAGLSEIRSYRITRTEAPRVTNSVAYIDLLNSGSSLQAPAGFVERAIADAIASVAGVQGK
jgi:hypothetical protein